MPKLGEEATDSITSFTGIVTAIAACFGGHYRVYVTPTGVTSEGAMKKSHWFEWGRLTDEPHPALPSIVGREVADEITGIKGKVTAQQTHLKGCIMVELTPPGVNKDGVPHEVMVIDEARVLPKGESLGTGAIREAGLSSVGDD